MGDGEDISWDLHRRCFCWSLLFFFPMMFVSFRMLQRTEESSKRCYSVCMSTPNRTASERKESEDAENEEAFVEGGCVTSYSNNIAQFRTNREKNIGN